MSSIQKNITGKHATAKKGLKIGIVRSEYNSEIGKPLLESCLKTLLKSGVAEKNIKTVSVPGAFEIPFVCQKMAKTKGFHAIIALGAIIRGDTPHFDYIASSCAQGIMGVSLKTDVPIIFGVLTTENMAQAKARTEKGTEAALTAIEMTNLNV
jgi:6,7-dimethyl-8-ribityllumazine synthase